MTPALSPSRAADFKQCPLLYRFRAIDRIETPPSPAAARGTLVHSVLEHLFDLPADERTPAAALELVQPRWAALVEHRPELATMIEQAEDLDESGWLDEAGALVRRWFTLEDPRTLEPEARELYVEAEIDGLTLRGYVDRLDVSPEGLMRVVDYKTGKSPAERYQGKALFQMKFYALVLWRMRGQIPARLQLVYIGDGEVVRYDPDEHDLRGFQRVLQALWGAIARAAQTGDWRPSRSPLCQWCDFQSLCPEFGGTPPPLPASAASIAVDPAVSGAAVPDDD